MCLKGRAREKERVRERERERGGGNIFLKQANIYGDLIKYWIWTIVWRKLK